jgi:high-affinity Fe2+/Pb2+ permease
MAAGIAFLAMIVTLVFAAVGLVVYVARRFNRD